MRRTADAVGGPVGGQSLVVLLMNNGPKRASTFKATPRNAPVLGTSLSGYSVFITPDSNSSKRLAPDRVAPPVAAECLVPRGRSGLRAATDVRLTAGWLLPLASATKRPLLLLVHRRIQRRTNLGFGAPPRGVRCPAGRCIERNRFQPRFGPTPNGHCNHRATDNVVINQHIDDGWPKARTDL